MKRKTVSSTPHGLYISSCLQIPTLRSFLDFLQQWNVTRELKVEINPFFSEFFMVTTFSTAIEILTKTHIHKNKFLKILILLAISNFMVTNSLCYLLRSF